MPAPGSLLSQQPLFGWPHCCTGCCSSDVSQHIVPGFSEGALETAAATAALVANSSCGLQRKCCRRPQRAWRQVPCTQACSSDALPAVHQEQRLQAASPDLNSFCHAAMPCSVHERFVQAAASADLVADAMAARYSRPIPKAAAAGSAQVLVVDQVPGEHARVTLAFPRLPRPAPRRCRRWVWPPGGMQGCLRRASSPLCVMPACEELLAPPSCALVVCPAPGQCRHWAAARS